MSEVRKPAVNPDRTLGYTSVSAVKKFQTCNAAWFYRYVLRRPEPQGAGALESDGCHKRVEHYLKTGENVLDEIERRALRRGLFPQPNDPKNPRRDDLLIEAQLDTLDAYGVPFIVKVDCIDLRTPGLIVINDWKFKKDIKKWGTSRAKLCDPTDDDGIQMVGYGEAVRRAVAAGKLPHAPTIRLRHVQVDKAEDAAEEVYVDLPIDDFGPLWVKVAATLPKMKATALLEDVALAEGNKRACFKFGGCAFKAECPHYKSKAPADQTFRLKALFKPKHERSANADTKEEKDMGMLSKMSKNAAVTPVAVQAAPTPPPAPAAAPMATPKPSLIIDESTVPDAVLKANPNVGQPVAAVLPPDAPTPVKTEAAPVAQAEPIPEVSAEKPKRGRKPKEAAAVTSAPVTAGEGFTLFIGCRPRSGATSLMPYVDALEQTALAGFKEQLKLEVDDIRLATGSDVGFGKWKAVLGALAKDSPPAPGRYSVLALGMDERVDAVIAALETVAADVVTR